ncbi:MAG: dockerin type I repeat-containing protein [Clostridia bacterium]|nr:dockerin type I repeat-containing protein [Clostridia bacterium]
MKKKILCAILSAVMAISAMASASADDAYGKYDESTVQESFQSYVNTYHRNMYVYIYKALGTLGDYLLFSGGGEYASSMEIIREVCGSAVFSPEIYSPYDISLYVFNGKEVCTLEEALQRNYFKMADVEHILGNRIVPKGDSNTDYVVNMEDVITMQKAIAKLCYAHPVTSDMNSDGTVNMNDVTMLQRAIAKMEK